MPTHITQPDIQTNIYNTFSLRSDRDRAKIFFQDETYYLYSPAILDNMGEVIKTQVTDQNIVLPQKIIEKFHVSKGDYITWIIDEKAVTLEISKEKKKLSSLIGAFDGPCSNSLDEHELIP